MTKLRAPATFEDAVTRIAGAIGWTACAEVVGKVEKVVRNWSDPDMDRRPSIEEAVALDAAYLAAVGGEPPLLAVYQLMLARRAAPSPDTAALARAVSETLRESGEAGAASVAAMSPDADAGTIALAVRELDEGIDSSTRLRALLASRLPGGGLTAIDGGKS